MPQYLDTFVFTDMLSGTEHAKQARSFLQQPSVVSSIIFTELSYHISKKDKDGAEEILHFVQSLPQLKIVPVNREIAALAGRLRAKYRKRIEKKLTYFDCIHIATAISERCERFVTGDRGMRGVSEIDVEVY